MDREIRTKKELINDVLKLESHVAGLEQAEKASRELENTLRETIRKWDEVFNAINDAVCLMDTRRRVLRCNNAMAKLLNRSVDDIKGSTICDIVHHPAVKIPIMNCPVMNMFESGRREVKVVASGSKWFEMIADPVKDEAGTSIGAVHIIKDITDRKEAEFREKELIAVKAREEEANRKADQLHKANKKLKEMQDRLVRSEKLAALGRLSGSVGHEIRTPLGTMSNAVYLLKAIAVKRDKNKSEKKYLDILAKEINHVNEIIEAILQFGRIKGPKMGEMDLVHTIKTALKEVDVPGNIEVKTDIPVKKLFITADKVQIKHVLINVFKNAVQAMPDGGILEVSARHDGVFADIVVKDTGEGIEKQHLNKIFEPLFSTRDKGSGLGLALCQSFIEMHEGKIEVKSRPGKGTSFEIKLPLDKTNLPFIYQI